MVLRLKKLLEFISMRFLNMGIMKKLTAAYTIAILMPTLLIGLYSYSYSQEYIKSEFIKSSSQTLSQITDNVDLKIRISQSLSENITYNTKVKRFLYNNFTLNFENLYEYKNIINTIINTSYNFRQTNIYNISMFLNNKSITESWPAFYNEDRLAGQEWYKSFKSSSQDNIWLGPHEFYTPVASNNKNNKVYTFIKKITAEGNNKYLGIVTLDILENEMFSSAGHLPETDEVIYVISGEGEISYTSDLIDKGAELHIINHNNIKGEKGYFINKDILYLYDTAVPLNVRIIYKVPMGKLADSLRNTGRNMIIIILPGVILMEVVTYFIFKFIISKLKYIVSVMNKVSQGKFDVTVVIKNKDEIGQLAEDFNILIEKINILFKENIEKETAQKDAQLKALQYQINPHFIYNTIDIFRMKMELAGDYDTAKAITDFGKILRYKINSKSKYTTIKDEIQQVEKYVNLRKLGQSIKVVLNTDIPKELEDKKMIKFVLQPIVENCIKHGLVSVGQPISINICFEVLGEKVRVTISDDGKGIDVERLQKLNDQFRNSAIMKKNEGEDDSIGLTNINERVKLFYGKDNYIRMESVLGKYTKTIFYITLIEDAQ